MINFPETLEQIEKLKAEGISFDKVIFLKDTSENEGAVFIERNKDNDRYDHARALEDSKAKLALYQEQFGEDMVIVVDCNGTEEEVFTKLLTKLDPFQIRVDKLDRVKVTEDLQDGEFPLPRGEYGYFCPVTFTNDSWRIPGTSDNEVQVKERVY